MAPVSGGYDGGLAPVPASLLSWPFAVFFAISKNSCIFAAESLTNLKYKIMAIINSMGVGKARGSMGNVTYRTVKGQTIVSQKLGKGLQALGTYKQVARRVRMANLVFAYRAFNNVGDGAGMYQAFPFRDAKSSPWNEFFKKNINRMGVGDVVLSKEQSASGKLIPAPFLMSEGHINAPRVLTAVEASSGNPAILSTGEFVFGSRTSGMSADTTDLATFSSELIAAWGLQNGDVITIFAINSTSGSSGAVTKVNAIQVVLNTQDAETMMSNLGFETITIASTSYIGVSGIGNCGAAMIVGRSLGNSYDVSTSYFALTTIGEELRNDFNSQLALQRAIESYGYKLDPYLQKGVPQ